MTDFKSILQEIGYESIMENSRELRMRPIYRNSDSNTVLLVYKDNGNWIDFSRGLSGSFEELVRLSLKLSTIEDSKQWLKDKEITIVKTTPKPKLNIPKIFDKDILLRLKKDYSYWEGRGISKETLEKFGGGIAPKGKMAGRYVFPIFNSEEKIVGFAGRDIHNNTDRPKWKLISNAKSWVYPAFLNIEGLKRDKTVVLVEGISDCLALYSCGIENVLVLFGINLSNSVLNFLLRLDMQKIIISTNNDLITGKHGVGNLAAEEIKSHLLKFFDEKQIEIRLPKIANDWGDVLIKFDKNKVIESFLDVYS